MRWSEHEFGAAAAARYDVLMSQGIRDISEVFERPGCRQRPELGDDMLTLHLSNSRDRARSELGVVRRPRHFLVFRRTDNGVELLRVIHDARDIQQHVPGETEG